MSCTPASGRRALPLRTLHPRSPVKAMPGLTREASQKLPFKLNPLNLARGAQASAMRLCGRVRKPKSRAGRSSTNVHACSFVAHDSATKEVLGSNCKRCSMIVKHMQRNGTRLRKHVYLCDSASQEERYEAWDPCATLQKTKLVPQVRSHVSWPKRPHSAFQSELWGRGFLVHPAPEAPRRDEVSTTALRKA